MKILRLHEGTEAGATDNINGWGNSKVISEKAVESIQDPQGSNAQSEITSIPSPFARLDLVKQAFKYVNEQKNLDGTNIYYRMVSDALDVGEIFFNIDKFSNIVELTEWDVSEIQNLKASADPQQQLLGNTLELFIQSDRANNNVYNLQKLQSIYILSYIGPGAPSTSALPGHVIGATSPCTLFFTPANDLGYVTSQILFEGNNDRPFDGDFNPLYKRDPEYVRYLVWLTRQPDFRQGYPEVFDYVQATVTQINSIDNKFGQELGNIKACDSLDTAPVTMHNGKKLLFAGEYPVMRKHFNADQVAEKSEFTIRTAKPVEGLLPLVLPLDHSCNGLTYTSSAWDGGLIKDVPFEDGRELSKRTLPGINVEYPYLTAGDFLCQNILYTDYALEPFETATKDYITLGDDKTLRHYLLPIKPEFFRYFDTGDLSRLVHAVIKHTGDQESIEVTINVPIKGQNDVTQVTYTRTYWPKDPQNGRMNGKIINLGNTGVTILPHVRFPEKVQPDYRITLALDNNMVERDMVSDLPTLAFLKDTTPIESTHEGCRNLDSQRTRKDNSTSVAKQWSLESDFTAIIVAYKGTEGMLVPLMKDGGGSKKFYFAVDFGTTNTHIEYAIENSGSRAFDTHTDDAQLRPVPDMMSDAEWTKMQSGELIPAIIGEGRTNGNSISFPIRTAITSPSNVDWTREVVPLVDANIPFFYERKLQPNYNEPPTTDLKWNSDEKTQARTRCFLSELAMLMRNKVLMNNGDLSATQLVWFYPTSMSLRQVGNFANIWKDVFKRYFDGASESQISKIPEAIAPLPAFSIGSSSAITIDIGGGTSDFLFAEGKDIKCISSARFASNSLFGSPDNGFIRFFEPKYAETTNTNIDFRNIMSEIKKGANKSNMNANLASFFFSIAESTLISDDNVREKYDFKHLLESSEPCNALILIYYMALIYYAAQVCRMKGLKEPRYIGFSGNGSKILNIFLDNEYSEQGLVEITKRVFEKVLGHPYDEDGLQILRPHGQSPKAATAQGGIESLQQGIGGYDKLVETSATTWTGASDDEARKYADITAADEQAVISHVKEFIDICHEAITDTDIKRRIELPTDMDKVFQSRVFSRDINKYIKDGCAQVSNKDEEVQSSLFFLPVEGILHALTNELLQPNN